MSRTFRRKNFEKTQNRSWDKRGSSIAGYYTYRTYVYVRDVDSVCRRVDVYREPTKRERYKAFRWAHGESRTRSERSPNSWHRKNRMRENRSINKEELHRWIRDPDNYEPLFEADPRSCLWDWW